jgi:putative ABC transport system permease protein
MIKNYLKIAWRNLFKNGLYSLINIGGLAVGMAVSFMLLLYVYNEFSFDKFNTNADRLYCVYRNQPSGGDFATGRAVPVKLAAMLAKDYPEIEQSTRTNSEYPVTVNYNNRPVKLQTLAADPTLLDMFTFTFVKGNKQTALAGPTSIVLTETSAKTIFGDANPIGQIVKFDNQFPLKVTGVIKDNPQNSSFDFAALIPWSALEAQESWVKTSGWGNYSFMAYVMLRPGASLDAINAKIKNVIARYDPDNKENQLFLYPLTRNHLYSDFKDGKSVGGSIEYVRLFLFLAIGILLIACINFMNLSTARSERRAREVGVRKAIGANRFVLVQQFMGESILLSFMALILAIVLVILLLPVFDNIINIQLKVPYGNVWAWAGALGVTIFTGLIAGSYPALFLSSFKPVKVLKGQLINTNSTAKPRQILVVMQFTFAICLILSSIFIYKQIGYIKDRPVGYDKNALVEMPFEGSMMKKFDSFRQDAINAGAIVDGAITSGSIVNNGSSTWGVKWQGQKPGEDKIPIDQIAVTWHFTSTYGLKVIEGRDFESDHPADSSTIMLNQSAVKMMGFKNPIGQIVKWQDQQRTVIGIVKDFVWGSPYEPVKPAIIGFMKDWEGNIGLKLNPNRSVSSDLATLQTIYKQYNPDYPFDYKFADEQFNKKFANEQLLGTMSFGFTCLCIIISCLGLFGLAAFSAEQRRKEIGIRKVLGASLGNLWYNLSREFFVLVCISFVLGASLSWYVMHTHFEKYTYHTDLSLWVFALTMLLSLAICLITVSWQAIRSALANPVKSLRSE